MRFSNFIVIHSFPNISPSYALCCVVLLLWIPTYVGMCPWAARKHTRIPIPDRTSTLFNMCVGVEWVMTAFSQSISAFQQLSIWAFRHWQRVPMSLHRQSFAHSEGYALRRGHNYATQGESSEGRGQDERESAKMLCKVGWPALSQRL